MSENENEAFTVHESMPTRIERQREREMKTNVFTFALDSRDLFRKYKNVCPYHSLIDIEFVFGLGS